MTRAIPYLSVQNAAAALDFYQNAFGATEVMRLTEPGGKVGHAEIKIGEAMVMLADEYPEHGFLGPQSLGGTPVTIYLQVNDVDAVARQAVAAGATLTRPVEDQLYGERTGRLVDPFGHAWMIATTTEEMSAEDLHELPDEELSCRHQIFFYRSSFTSTRPTA